MRVKPVSREISSLVFFLNLAQRQNQNVTISELKENNFRTELCPKMGKTEQK